MSGSFDVSRETAGRNDRPPRWRTGSSETKRKSVRRSNRRRADPDGGTLLPVMVLALSILPLGRRPGVRFLDHTMIELPRVIEKEGMAQRKPGTTCGSPRHSRTAKALRISRWAGKSQCARGWGGWGRLSDDDPRQHNLDPSEGPWGGGFPHLHGGARFERSTRHRAGLSNPYEVRERQTQTAHQSAYARSS
jgi:hypothetical protein